LSTYLLIIARGAVNVIVEILPAIVN